MALPIIMTGAQIVIFINNKQYSELQSMSFSIDYNEQSIFGIDSTYAQELASNRITVTGSVVGLRVKQSGGLQGKNMRSLFQDAAAAPYISIRIQDRTTKEDIVFFPNCKITRESHSAAAKQVYRMNFDFVAQLPLMALDRS
jgi:hypothetical protein